MSDKATEIKARAIAAGTTFVDVIRERAEAAADDAAKVLKEAAEMAANYTMQLGAGGITADLWADLVRKIEVTLETKLATIAIAEERAATKAFLQGAAKLAIGILGIL